MNDDAKKLAKLIKGIKIAMLTTVDTDGTLRSRPMATQEQEFDGGALWFATDVNSHKVEEIRADSHVNVSYADPDDSRYVSVSGRAELVKDRAKVKELWGPGLKAWYPDGPDDPNIMLLRVDVEKAEYWDTPSNKLVQLVGFTKAILVGERYDPAENKKLDFGGHGTA